MSLGRLLALAVVSGTAMGAATGVAASDAFAASLAALSLAALCKQGPRQRALFLAAVVSLLVAHGAWAADRTLAPPLLEWFAAAFHDTSRAPPVLVEGTLARDAEAADAGARLLIDVRVVHDATGRHPVGGRVQAFVAGALSGPALSNWTRGRPIRAPIGLRPPQVLLNPGAPSPRWQALRRPFHLVGTIKSAVLVDVAPAAWWDEMAARIRASVRIRANRLFSPERAQTSAVVTAILIGDRAGLDPAVEERLQAAGTYHVIAISGGNVAILTALCLLGLRVLRASPRPAAMATILVVASYGWIVGGEPSVSRATTAACIYLAATLAGLAPRPLDVLSLAATLIVMVDPLVVVDASAWLSFGATLGIVLWANRFTSAMNPSRSSQVNLHRRVMAAITAVAGGLLAATLAAEAAILPVSAAVFSRVGLAGLVLNFVAIPAMAVVQIAGLVGVILVGWWTSAATLAAGCAHLAATALVGSAQLVEWQPWLSWRVPPPSLVTIAVYYTAAAWLLWEQRGTTRRTIAMAVAAMSAIVIMFSPATSLAGPRRGWLRVTTIDVGQGDAIVVQFPTGHSLLVDAGGNAGFDVGSRIVTPALWALGARRLDWLAMTHADFDHIGGAETIAATFSPREVWEGVPVPSDRTLARVRAVAAGRGAVWRQLQGGDQLELGGVAVSVVHPPRPDWERQRPRNDDSLVVRLRYGDAEFLLTGDISADVERQLAVNSDRRPLRVLKVAHHGSRTSSSADFIRSYGPVAAIVSAGRSNPFGHPAPEVARRFVASGARVFRTDLDGAVIVETDGRELSVRTMSGRMWRVRVWPAGT